MTTWSFLVFLHVMAMAFFVGGQLYMASVVLPVLRGGDERDKEKLRAAGRNFLTQSAVALVVLIITGAMLASHYELWDNPNLHVKLGLVALVVVLIAWHKVKSTWHWLEGVIFLVSLVIVYLGILLVQSWV